jgi:hypothetical protein
MTIKTINTTAGSRTAATSRSAPRRSGRVFIHTAMMGEVYLNCSPPANVSVDPGVTYIKISEKVSGIPCLLSHTGMPGGAGTGTSWPCKQPGYEWDLRFWWDICPCEWSFPPDTPPPSNPPPTPPYPVPTPPPGPPGATTPGEAKKRRKPRMRVVTGGLSSPTSPRALWPALGLPWDPGTTAGSGPGEYHPPKDGGTGWQPLGPPVPLGPGDSPLDGPEIPGVPPKNGPYGPRQLPPGIRSN